MTDRPPTQAEAAELDDLVQEAALRAWRIHHDDRRNRRKMIRWAMAARLRVMLSLHLPGVVTPE